ncbi:MULTISPECIES: helix-turn-helix transcriptional regulator [unclassified Xanthomonas]|uniref:helix-turn-helix transcriptional regulator n=1 Tax=Xanthomonas sp. LMG 9002 TaxID=1591158 RepID=UPI0013719AE4|nr:helix-turn-helix transcriptional regulator [Xanthomonas sp. LMG 9002]MXV06989.1 AraC family transcriptional regulator [Xanthomonas sp. LMG 9002]
MADTTSPDALLLARLASLADCAQAEGYACISARREHGARSVEIPRPQLAILLQGRKQVRTATQTLAFVPGDLFLVTRRCRIDVVNIPDPNSGVYLSVLVPLCEEALSAARVLWNEPLPAAGAELARLRAEDVGGTLLQWRQALQDGRYTEARLALAALVVALCRRGHGGLLLPPAPSVAAQVRDLVAAQPQRAWRSRDIEDSLGLSGATLRRHLASEGTSLRELLADARLAHAMQLLYTTRWPLKTVAAHAGYRSVRSFSQRFQQRYGLDPASIGN